MKILRHRLRSTEVCVYSVRGDKVRASFAGDKPELGDVLLSHGIKDDKGLKIFRIDEFTHQGRVFELSVSDVTNDPEYSEVDNSINSNY